MTTQEAFLRGCLIADTLHTILPQKEYNEQITIWQNTLNEILLTQNQNQ